MIHKKMVEGDNVAVEEGRVLEGVKEEEDLNLGLGEEKERKEE